MGFKTFTSAALTASDVNDYLMKQVNIVCTSATRPTAVEGMRIYETDTDRELTYDGTGWVIMSEPSQSYTPTFTNFSSTSPTVDFRYKRCDGWCEVVGAYTFGASGTSVTGIMGISTPFTMHTATLLGADTLQCTAGGSVSFVQVLPGTTTRVDLYALNAGGTYLTPTATSSTVPGSWANTNLFRVAFRFQMSDRYQ